MTTYTLNGFSSYYDNDIDADVGVKSSTTLELVLRDDITTMRYSVLPLAPGDSAPDDLYVDVELDLYNVRVDGELFQGSDSDPDTSIFQLNWTDAGNVARVSTILILEEVDANVPPFGTVDSQHIFLLGGDALPTFNSLAEFNDFLDNALDAFDVPPASSPFGPDKDIALSSLSGSSTENDLIVGDDGDNEFDGGAGNDTILGLDGSDTLRGGDGNDSLNPGTNDDGYDEIVPGAGQDTVDFSDVDSTTSVGLGQWDLDAGVTVTINGQTNTASVDKGANGTTQIINVGNTFTWGLSVFGSSHNDIFNITPVNDEDTFLGVTGREGDDTFNFFAGDGFVRLNYRQSDVTSGVNVNLNTGLVSNDGYGDQDTINGVENLSELRTTMLDDSVLGSDGRDRVILMAGNDTADGGDGFDLIRYDRSQVEAVNVNLQTGTATGTWRGEAFNHQISNFEEVRGSRDGNDTIIGNDAVGEYIEGRGGDDSISGGGGDDTLIGEEGNDTLLGGDGSDRLESGDGDDSINPGSNNDGYDEIIAGTGNDTVDFSDLALNGSAGLQHYDLDAGITVTVDADTNSASIDKGANGTTQIVDIYNALNGYGIDIGGTAHDDIFNIISGSDQDPFLSLRGDAGNDTFNLSAGDGFLRLDYRSFGGVTGVNVDLSTGAVSEDGFGGQDTINGVDNVNEIRTTMLDDSVLGGDGRDRVILMAGNDTADGGDGFDLLRYDRNQVEAVNVNLNTGTATGTWRGEAFNHTISNFEEVRGSRDGDDTIIGSNAVGEYIEGRGGDDSIRGGGGEDTLYGQEGNDTLLGGGGSDRLEGGDGDDSLNPGSNSEGYDAIIAGAGNDTINLSNLGSSAGVGLEHWDLDAGATITVNGATNSASVDKGVNGTTQIINISNAINDWGLDVSGTHYDDIINITSGPNANSFIAVIGEGGNDTFNINAGASHVRLDYRRSDVFNGVDVNLSTGIAANDGYGGEDTINGVENLTSLRTTMLDDSVIGSAGDDQIILMAGNDTADGGDGIDLIRYDRTGVEAVNVNLNTGTATGTWRGEAFNHQLSNFEEIRGSRDFGDTLTGKDGQANEIDGQGGKDTIQGGENGNDSLHGGDGNDSLTGLSGDDFLTGDGGKDVLRGDEGRDTLIGGLGGDTLLGGDQADSLVGDDGRDELFAGEGADTLEGGDGNDTLGGSGGNDRIFGQLGNDIGYGGQGNDIMDGGEGNDQFFAGKGNDTVYGRLGDDVLGGAAGDDQIFGEDGNDTIFGGKGEDVLGGGSGNDSLAGGADNDTLFGGADNDVLRGGGGNDSLSAGTGTDTLDGGTGNDTLRGGSDDDTFVFSNGVDQVVDFGAGDRIDLSGVVSEITDFADLQATHLSGGANAVISDGLGNTLTLLNVAEGSLVEGDFIF